MKDKSKQSASPPESCKREAKRVKISEDQEIAIYPVKNKALISLDGDQEDKEVPSLSSQNTEKSKTSMIAQFGSPDGSAQSFRRLLTHSKGSIVQDEGLNLRTQVTSEILFKKSDGRLKSTEKLQKENCFVQKSHDSPHKVGTGSEASSSNLAVIQNVVDGSDSSNSNSEGKLSSALEACEISHSNDEESKNGDKNDQQAKPKGREKQTYANKHISSRANTVANLKAFSRNKEATQVSGDPNSSTSMPVHERAALDMKCSKIY